MKHENMAITSAIIKGITSALTTYALCLKHNILHIWFVLTYLTYIVNTIIPSYNKIIDINIFPYSFGFPVLQGEHFLSDLRKLTAVSESLSSSLRKYSVLRENHYYIISNRMRNIHNHKNAQLFNEDCEKFDSALEAFENDVIPQSAWDSRGKCNDTYTRI